MQAHVGGGRVMRSHVALQPLFPRARLGHAVIAVAMACAAVPALAVAPAGTGSFVVTHTGDGGAGSLRQAIVDLNSAGGGDIRFAIPGNCLHTIAPATPLPAVTVDALIDGLSQPGSSANTSALAYDARHCVVLNSNIAIGLRLEPPAGATITVRGLGFDNFNDAAIDIDGDGAVVLEGNAIGSGYTAVFNGFAGDAVRIANAPGTVIGGDTPATRNVIGNAADAGVLLGMGGPRTVRNNLIGIGASGISNIGNGVGIDLIDAYGSLIEANSIGYNLDHGVRVAMPTPTRPAAQGEAVRGGPEFYNRIVGNRIGYLPVANGGSRDGGNLTNGIRLTSGGNVQVLDNTIAYNSNDGLNARAPVQAARISGNRFLRNGSQAIDLFPDGIDPQDEDTVPGTGANGTQNFPVLGSAFGSASAGTVSGTLTTRGGSYTIEFYANATCDSNEHGEADAFIGAIDVTVSSSPIPPGDKTVAFSAPLQAPAGGSLANGVVVALVHDASGNTSELSRCVAYTDFSVFVDGFEG